MWRTRNLYNREQRNTSAPAEGTAVPPHALNNHTDTNFPSPSDGDIIFWDSATSKWINGAPGSLSHPIAAHGEIGSSSSTLTAAANNTWQSVPWPTSIITSVTVCPLSFFTAGGSQFTIPEDGYYHIEINLALAADPDLAVATLEFGLFRDGVLQRTFYCSSNDWSLNYSEVAELCAANTVFELKFRRNGAGYATVVDLTQRGNMAIHKIAAVGFGGATAHALNNHTDTNFPSPSDGDVISWDNGTSKWTAGAPVLVAHAFANHTDANANLASPGAGLDQYVIVWDNASTSFKLVANTAVAGPHALNTHTDTNLGSPGAPQDGYVIAWNNGTGKYVLVAPTTPGAHALGSHSDVTLTSPSSGQVLSYNGSAWVNSTLSVNLNLDDLLNVNTTGKANRDIIWWDSGAGKWVKRTLVLGDISNVNTTGATAGQSLVYNGTTWVPGSPSASVTAKWGYFYSNGSGFVAGSGSGTSLNTGFTPNRFTVSESGVWLFQVHCSGSTTPGDLSISHSGGGSTPGTTYGNTCLASLPAGGYFTVTGPNPVGNYYSITLTKVGN